MKKETDMFGMRHRDCDSSREGHWAGGRRWRRHFGGDFAGGGRHGMGGGEMMRAGRMLAQGDLRLIALALIAEQPRHGYEIIKVLEDKTAGWYSPSPGIVYPTLTMLNEMGLIDEQLAESARKQFAVTPEGTTHLAEHDAEVVAMLARLDELAAIRERTDAVPIRRAMHNLRSVLMSRLGEGLDKERMHEAVELIDEAARKIERL
jgi:DNA-binding PadR family transcriptional regulator